MAVEWTASGGTGRILDYRFERGLGGRSENLAPQLAKMGVLMYYEMDNGAEGHFRQLREAAKEVRIPRQQSW